MASIFGGYRMQVYHEVAQRIALALDGKVAEDSQAALVPAPLDRKVCQVLKAVPGVIDFVVPEHPPHEYVRQLTVKRAKRNAVRFLVIRKSERDAHAYLIRPFKGRQAAQVGEALDPAAA